jgi:hypothetical protein
MPFDGKVSDYFETKPAPVYDRNNPPPTMAEAIRMAVADVEAQERAGIQYDWNDCARCTAGAVVRRIGLDPEAWNWGKQKGPWGGVLSCLSSVSIGWDDCELHFAVRNESRAAARFFDVPNLKFSLTPYSADPDAFKRDMLALADRLEAEGV